MPSQSKKVETRVDPRQVSLSLVAARRWVKVNNKPRVNKVTAKRSAMNGQVRVVFYREVGETSVKMCSKSSLKITVRTKVGSLFQY